jgi:hypothetical protein
MIFLHSSFRVSSTWFWSKFRSQQNVIAYREVFHEKLASLFRANWNDMRWDNWNSNHPSGPAYFLEFLPLIKNEGGVDKYDASMAYELFMPREQPGDAISEAERTYLASLIAHAETNNKFPVLSCTRSLGRLRAIKASFPGLHILIYRNLFHQWCSYAEQYTCGNPYFLDTIRYTVEASQHDPFFRRLLEAFPLDTPAILNSNYFYCFALLHLYLYSLSVDAADLIVDVNEIAADAANRATIERQIAEASGIAVDISDIRTKVGFSLVRLGSASHLSCQLKGLADLALPRAVSPKAREFASKVLSDLIEEYARYDFYAGRLVKWADPGGLFGECGRLRAERDKAVAERASLIAEKVGLIAEKAGLIDERDRLAHERDRLVASPLRAFRKWLETKVKRST